MSPFETATMQSWLLSYLLNALWQIPLLFCAGWVAARLLRSAGAAAEHRAWVAVVVLETLLPAFSLLPLDWLGVLFGSHAALHAAGEAEVSILIGPGMAWGAPHLSGTFLGAVALAYLAVTTWFAARFGWRWLQLRALCREAMPARWSAAAAQCWQNFAARHGLPAGQVLTSPRVFGPVTVGILHRRLILPESLAATITEPDLRAVLAHECAHMARHDFAKNLVYELLSLPVSFHPLLWLTRRRLGETREVVCDERAAAEAGRTAYARSLLRLACFLVEQQPVGTAHALGLFHTHSLERRIMQLKNRRPPTRGLRRVATLALSTALGFGACASALALHMRVDGVAASADHSQPGSAHPFQVSRSVMAGNRIGGPVPKYPVEAKKKHIQGTVVLDAMIGTDGKISDLKAASGPKELRQSALDAVAQWTYKPYRLNGQPVAVETTINITYSLGK